MRLPDRIFSWLGRAFRREEIPAPPPKRGPRDLVVILDGTLSTLDEGCETNAGLAYKLLRGQRGKSLALYYEAGLQWDGWRDTLAVMTGNGIGSQIQRAYGWLASNYRPGDRIWLIGYSRGAYAVRSLSGIIGRVGLLKRDRATQRNENKVYQLYCNPNRQQEIAAFRDNRCHDNVQIEAIAVWDTVKALGLRLPVFWIIANRLHGFHDHDLGHHVRAGFHALAYNETRRAYAPVLWDTQPGWSGRLEQVWFRGTHADIGGQLNGRDYARPLSNIPFTWIFDRLSEHGLPLPDDWKSGFPTDPKAPSIGGWTGWARFFFARWPRKVGQDRSERLHETLEPHVNSKVKTRLTAKGA